MKHRSYLISSPGVVSEALTFFTNPHSLTHFHFLLAIVTLASTLGHRATRHLLQLSFRLGRATNIISPSSSHASAPSWHNRTSRRYLLRLVHCPVACRGISSERHANTLNSTATASRRATAFSDAATANPTATTRLRTRRDGRPTKRAPSPSKLPSSSLEYR